MSAARPPCDPSEHGYAFVDPSGKVHVLDKSHPKWAEDYLSDHPELGSWLERVGGLLKHGWIRVANVTNLSVAGLDVPPKAAWKAVLDMVVDCVRKGLDPDSIIRVDHGVGDQERSSAWTAADFARRFGGRAYEDAVFDAALSRPAVRRASVGKHKLPKLPYAYDALDPHISEETLRFHHDKHHKAYVDGLNEAERAIAAARKSGDFEAIPALNAAQAFNAGGHALHTAYWESLTPDHNGPSEALVAAIEKDFGSWEAFRSQLRESTVKVRGSGWGVLVLTPAGMRVLTVMNHEDGVLWDGRILLPIDAWEHAYYLDYRNDRAAHFDAVFDNLVNWSVVERRLDDAPRTSSRTAKSTVAGWLRGVPATSEYRSVSSAEGLSRDQVERFNAFLGRQRRTAARLAARREVDCHLKYWGLDELIRGGSAKLYHGTTRQFQRFDAAYIRHDLINRFYKAPGIFLAPRESVASRYAMAARNSMLPASVVGDLTRRNPGAGMVLGRLVREGAEAWDGLFADAVAQFPSAETPFDALEQVTGGVDPNTLMDIAQHIEGSNYDRGAADQTLFDLWGMTSTETPEYILNDLDNVGLDSSEYRPKIYTVSVSGLERVLVTKSKSEAEKARARGYDAVVFCGADLVDGAPEVVVFDPSKVRVVKAEVVSMTPSDEPDYYDGD
jgi:superoxide dismutase